MSRCRGNPALVYQGPNGLAGWGPPEAAAAWSDDGGQLTTDHDSAVLECDVKLPAQALIELAISWKSQPDFALVLGSDCGDDAGARRAFRFEILDGELIARRETQHDFDIESVMPLGMYGPGRIHLLALLDQEQERLQVLSPDGKPLAAIHAAADVPRVGPGIRLEHPKVAGVVAACPGEEVQLVAVNLQETSAEAADALRRLKLDVPVALDSDGKVAKEYGATSIPCTVVVGPDGKVARVFVGTGPQFDRQLAAALTELRSAQRR
ncbi:MAG TPA: TlpA disulfide reductase family protein [Pirellulales bacterium]|nr:TlpA disulfide reductase family protein [Pirellulales bacterium]